MLAITFVCCLVYLCAQLTHSCFFFFFKQKTAYEMRISDWSSDMCSSDLPQPDHPPARLRSDARFGPGRADGPAAGHDQRPARQPGPRRSEERRVGKE